MRPDSSSRCYPGSIDTTPNTPATGTMTVVDANHVNAAQLQAGTIFSGSAYQANRAHRPLANDVYLRVYDYSGDKAYIVSLQNTPGQLLDASDLKIADFQLRNATLTLNATK